MECTLEFAEYLTGVLGNFLAKGLKSNQLEVNTDEKTLRPIARLKEPRDLFALPKDKDHDFPQQAPRWPIECQVIEERIVHINSVPAKPEPYNQPTGSELKPRPVGEENGVVVFNYNPVSAVNYNDSEKRKRHDSSDSDISSSESRGSTPECSTPERRKTKLQETFSKLFHSLQPRSSSNSNDEADENENEEAEDADGTKNGAGDVNENDSVSTPRSNTKEEKENIENSIEDIWAERTPEYAPATPTFIKSQFGKEVPKVTVEVTSIVANAITPVRIDAKQMARLKIDIVSNSSSSSSNAESDSNETEDEENVSKTVRQNVPVSEEPSSISVDPSLNTISSSVATLENQNATPQTDSTVQTSNNQSNISENAPKIPENDDTNVNIDNKDSISDSVPLPQFSRSSVGGSRILTNCHPCNSEEYTGLEFESRFESGNLAKAVQITKTYYELYLRSDLYTSRSKQWFYFRVRNTKTNLVYRFSIVNLVKSDSLYNDGMCPLMYSTTNATTQQEGWRRCGENICYYRNGDENSSGNEDEEENSSYTLTFNIEFPHENDTVYFAHSYPYTYSDLQDYLMEIQNNPAKSKFCKLRLLCRTLAGNNVYYLTVTAPTMTEEAMKRKKSIVVSARVHPSETPASWMMKGLMDFITGDSMVAKRLRHKFIFKLIPMLNPDGVIVGNTRNSLTGKDLNRQYRTVIRETYPSIWYTKAMIKRLIDECGVAMYCDMHAHSRKHNIFVYGCENKRNAEKKLSEQVFPLMMHKNVADKFSFENCKFKIQRSKEGTGRIVVWMLGITNSYTIEASFGGSSLGSRKGTHFNTADYEHMGRAFCETLWDYWDDNPNKERLRLKIIERLLKEGSSADEPLNIPLSDYSSDEGDSTSSSDNEGKASLTSDLEGPCCAPVKAPPSSPEIRLKMRKKRLKRMRKIMRELDRIYFQPMLQKRFSSVIKCKKRKINKIKKRKCEKSGRSIKIAPSKFRLEGGQDIKTLQPSESQTEQPSSSTVIPEARKIEKHKNCKKHNIRKMPDIFLSKPIGDQTSPNQKLRISRKMRLWLEKRKIFLYRRKRKNRKTKIRRRHIFIKKEDTFRPALDLPTTDPASDLHFSTDDEIDHNENSYRLGVTASLTPKSRSYLFHSELQRRYMEEIGDGADLRKYMPPELIITTAATKTEQLKISCKPVTPNTGPLNKQLYGDFSANEEARKTNSWHIMHNGERCVTRLKPQTLYGSINTFNGQTTEDLQIRLSVKKQVWTGMRGETDTNHHEPNQTWFLPALGAQPKREKSSLTLLPLKKDKNELLFKACSQKLLAWQQESELTSLSKKDKAGQNVIMPDIENDERTFRIFNHFAQLPRGQRTTSNSKLQYIDKKPKKKAAKHKSSGNLQIYARLSNSKTTFIPMQSRPACSTALPNNSYKQSKQESSNKFKVGGIVATAIQPIALRKSGTKPTTLPSNTKMNGSKKRTKSVLPATASKNSVPYGSDNTKPKIKPKPKMKSQSANSETTGATRSGKVNGVIKKTKHSNSTINPHDL